MRQIKTYKAIVVGVSAGGLKALKTILPLLPSEFEIPIIIVQHIGNSSEGSWIDILNSMLNITMKEAEEKEKIQKGYVYVAPSNYHLLIEEDETFTLTIDERVNFARPSIDVLFESAAEVYKDHLVGIALTSSSSDGVSGLKKIKGKGGMVIVQDPETAEAPTLPLAAIAAMEPDHILTLEKMKNLLINISKLQNDSINKSV